MKVPALNAALAGIAMLAAAAFLVLDDDGSGGPEPAGEWTLEALRAPVLLPRLGMDAARAGRHPRPQLSARDRPARAAWTCSIRPAAGSSRESGTKPEFGSLRWFLVAEVRGDWFGVPAPELGNGELGWIRDDRTVLDVSQTHYSIVADVSEQTVGLRYGDRVLDRSRSR